MKLSEVFEHVPDTKCLDIGDSIMRAPGIYRQYFNGKKGIIVADDNTYDVAGRDVASCFKSHGIELAVPFLYPGFPTLACDYLKVAPLKERILREKAVPIAVGSGTINDLAKVAAHECRTGYISVATATSVDGYASPGASIVKDGFKQSIFCRAPVAIIADTSVLTEAPYAMTAAGYADLSSKLTGGADWIVADILGIDPIDPFCWRMVQEPLRHWLATPELLKEKDPDVFHNLILGLSMTGFAMQVLRKSRPASGAEHLISHVWEMEHLSFEGAPVSHGFKVAIGTLISTALFETVFSFDISRLNMEERLESWPSWQDREREIREQFSAIRIVENAIEESRAKYQSEQQLGLRLAEVFGIWNDLKERALRQLLPYAELKKRYSAAGCPVTPEEIGLARDQIADACIRAGMIRNRYTILDFAYELGIFESCLTQILDSSVFLR